MQTRRINPFQIGTKTRMRFPRTNVLKRAGLILKVPNRPPKFDSWLSAPLSAFSGRFRRLRREKYTKPARAEYVRAALMVRDAAFAKELGFG